MLDSTGAPIPAPAAPQKSNRWIIVIVVVILLCCLCAGAIGLLLAFGGPILNEMGIIRALLPATMI